MIRQVETFTRITPNLQSVKLSCGHVTTMNNEQANKLRFDALMFRQVPSLDCEGCHFDINAASRELVDKTLMAFAVFMARFCENLPTDISFAERVEGNEDRIVNDFKAGRHPWDSSGDIVEEED